MLIGILPLNSYSAFNRAGFGGHGAAPVYYYQDTFQLLIISWTYFATSRNAETQAGSAS